MNSHEIELSERMSGVRHEVRDIVASAKKVEARGMRMHWLNVGDPNKFGFEPPKWVMDALKDALNEPKYCGYAPSPGDPQLREAIAKRESVEAENVFVTGGLVEGLYFSAELLLNSGDNFLFPSPVYPLYTTAARVYGGVENYYKMDEKWHPDIEDMLKKINERTHAIVVISPNNPTGAVYGEKELKKIADLAAEHKIPLICDEIYDGLVYGEKYIPAYKAAPDVQIIRGNGLSKNYFFTGARIGYLALHGEGMDKVRDGLNRLCNARLSVNWQMQRGAIAAYTHEDSHLQGRVQELRDRRDFFVKGINKIDGLFAHIPEGAFYSFVKVEGKWKSDRQFVKELLEKTGIVTVPGSAFSPDLDGMYFRAAYLAQIEELGQVLQKLEKFMKKNTV